MNNDKRVFISVLASAFAISFFILIISYFSSCNLQVLDTTYKYNSAYILLNGEWTKVDIESWRDYDTSDSIQIKTKEGVTYYTHLTNVILIAE